MALGARSRRIRAERTGVRGNCLSRLRKSEIQRAARSPARPLHPHDPGMYAMNVTIMATGAEKMRAGMSGVSVVIPVYRSEKILPELLPRLCEVLAAITAKREIILVNDCSPDGSWEVIVELA